MAKSETAAKENFKMWHSSYGILTAQRILEQYTIRLSMHNLSLLINRKENIFNQFLRVPMRQVFGGIIQDQVEGYQVYTQKLFVDYLISGEGNRDENYPGEDTREALEEERQSLIKLGQSFTEKCQQRSKSIAGTQKSLIELGKEFGQFLDQNVTKISNALGMGTEKKSVIKDALFKAMILSSDESSFRNIFQEVLSNEGSFNAKQATELDFQSFISGIEDIETKVEDLNEKNLPAIKTVESGLENYRKDFYNKILKITELLQQLPEYRDDPEHRLENLVPLNFDTNIGKKST